MAKVQATIPAGFSAQPHGWTLELYRQINATDSRLIAVLQPVDDNGSTHLRMEHNGYQRKFRSLQAAIDFAAAE